MKSKTKYRLHNLASNEIINMESESECCQAIDDLKLLDGQYEVTATVSETELVDITHALSLYRHKKNKKNKDVYAEASTPKGVPIDIIGEVIG